MAMKSRVHPRFSIAFQMRIRRPSRPRRPMEMHGSHLEGSSVMSDVHHIGRRPILAGIGAAALITSFDAPLVRAQALDRPPRVLIFDVAESLLDLQVLRPLFQRIFGDGAVVDEWFGQTILYSESATLTDTFVPFGQLGA